MICGLQCRSDTPPMSHQIGSGFNWIGEVDGIWLWYINHKPIVGDECFDLPVKVFL